MIAVVDPTRTNSVTGSYPGEAVVRMADIVVINKANLVDERTLESFESMVRDVNERAKIIVTDSIPKLYSEFSIRGKKVLAVEDGPTVTHGGLSEGVAARVALQEGAELVDPRPYAVGTIAETYKKYTHLGKVLPALGYSREQLKDLEETINSVPAEVVVLGTPANLSYFIQINKPIATVRYEAYERKGSLKKELEDFAKSLLK